MINEIREKALKNYSVEIILDSISESECRLTTMKLVYPRFIHAEFMTHRVFSRNASSSRAIPVQKMVENIESNPAIPLFWGTNKSGMQAGEELSNEKIIKAYSEWIEALDLAIGQAELLYDIGLHKQHVNRILEPFMLIEVLVTSTEWDNFFELRCHEDAQPEIQHLANLMRDALNESEPTLRCMHFPFVERIELAEHVAGGVDIDYLLKLSTARCARVSYTLRDGSIDRGKDIALHDRLVVAEPLHASPAEHQAVAMKDDSFNRNFRGWSMYRNKLEKGGW